MHEKAWAPLHYGVFLALEVSNGEKASMGIFAFSRIDGDRYWLMTEEKAHLRPPDARRLTLVASCLTYALDAFGASTLLCVTR